MPGAFFRLTAVIFLLALTGQAGAGGRDLHALWDDRCGDCHGHSAAFARNYLKVVEGRLQGRHHVFDLKRFLAQHYTPAGEAGAIYTMLLAQVQTPPRFSKECSQCHGSAADLVRKSIVLQQGRLMLRESGDGLREFMQTHRNLDADDIEFYLRLMARLANEIYRP